MRKPFIAGNWKMHKTVGEAVKYIDELRALVKDVDDVDVVAAPTFTGAQARAAPSLGSVARA